ncbi:hypothetical protein BDK61_4560 [Haloarcula quadrata]|uniref:Uncharacterized protein n=2 Tax=Haloarcula quadrata TaxID=182779 RepID=A0A495QR17_9EURY|nr:hypothetical protein BDK61_4560 [Haloarcula quadrata]
MYTYMTELDEETPSPSPSRKADGDSDLPEVPIGLLDGMDDIINGDTASKSDIEDVLKF